MKTSQAAEILGISAAQLTQLVRQHGIQVPKDIDRYIWSEVHIEEVREALRRAEERRKEAVQPGMTAREAAVRLGIAYEDLLGLIHEEGIAVPRLGPNRPYAFDEASLDLVREALEKEPEPEPEQPPRGLTTKEAAIALGVSYQVLVQRMKPLRQELGLQKDGAYFLWHPEAVARMREALDRRRAQPSIRETEDYEQAVELLAGALRKLAAAVRRLTGRR